MLLKLRMASDDETSDNQSKLEHREQFPGWKAKMSLLAMAKGDVDGIFTDQGDGLLYLGVPGYSARHEVTDEDEN